MTIPIRSTDLPAQALRHGEPPPGHHGPQRVAGALHASRRPITPRSSNKNPAAAALALNCLDQVQKAAFDARTTRHAGYAVSQIKRKCIEQCFGWGKTIGPIRQVMVRGLDKVDALFALTMAAYNLTRMRSLAQLRPQLAQ